MRILFLCEGETIPASRFRVAQFLPYFEEHGISCDLRFGYGINYSSNSARFGGLYKLLSRARRVAFAADADEFDVIFLQRPTFPHSAIGETLVNWINPRTLFDFDDSLWIGPSGKPSLLRSTAFRSAVRGCAHIIAGNEFLATFANHPEKTTVIPTVIDASRYVPSTKDRDESVVIGWMGTSGNFPFLEDIVPSIRKTLEKYPHAKFRIVSNSDFKPLLSHPRVEQIRWQSDTEIPLLQSFDIGLMPLTDSDLTRGKCAFKMIQYMSVGRPVVVSAVGANRDVFGCNSPPPGRMVSTFEWEDPLSELIEDARLRKILGENGRERVERNYSIAAVLPIYLRLFEKLNTIK